LRHPYQVRRLRSVFGSGRACRNSCDFRTAVNSASPRARRKALRGTWPRARRDAPRAPGAAQAARDSRPDSRHSPPGRPRLYRSRQAPALAPVACSRRMPLTITAITAAPPPHPPYITPSPQTPPFSHIIPYPPPPTRPRPAPAPAPVERHETPDPVRPNAVDPRFHCVLRPAPCGLRAASGSRPSAPHSAQPTRANPSANRTNAEPERKPRNPLICGKPFLAAGNTLAITLSCQPRDQARSVSRVFRVRCHIVTC